MRVVDKLMMVYIAVSDMLKAKEFYADKLGLKVTKDYRQDEDNWYHLPSLRVKLLLPSAPFTETRSPVR